MNVQNGVSSRLTASIEFKRETEFELMKQNMFFCIATAGPVSKNESPSHEYERKQYTVYMKF